MSRVMKHINCMSQGDARKAEGKEKNNINHTESGI